MIQAGKDFADRWRRNETLRNRKSGSGSKNLQNPKNFANFKNELKMSKISVYPKLADPNFPITSDPSQDLRFF